MKFKAKALIPAVAIAACGLASVPGAFASTLSCDPSISQVCIEVGGAVVATSTSGLASYDYTSTTGPFNAITVNGFGLSAVTAPQILDSNNYTLSAASSGSLTIFVTETNITSPLKTTLLSTLTTNTLPLGWSVTEATYADGSNTAFGTGTPLWSNTFTGPVSYGATSGGTAPINFMGAYSLTEEYTVNASGKGSANNTIDIAEAPEPGTLALFGAGLLGCALFINRRRASRQS